MPTSSRERVRALVGAVKTMGFLTAVAGTGFSISLCGIGVAAIAAAFLVEFVWFPRDARPAFPQAGLFAALAASLVVSLLISNHFRVSLRGLVKYAEGFILLYAALDIGRDPKNLRRVLTVLAAVFFVAAADGLYQHVFGRDFVCLRPAIHHTISQETGVIVPTSLRITGPFKHSNDYASLLVPAASLFLAGAAAALHAKRFRGAAAAMLAASAAIFSLLRTMSRSALVGFFVAVLILCLFSQRRRLYPGLVTAGLLAVLLVPSNFSTRLKELVDPAAGNLPERILLLRTTAKMVAARPFFGFGLNTYSVYFQEFRPATYPAAMYAHNSFIQMATETGLLGLGLYLGFVSALFVGAARMLAARAPSPARTVAAGVFAGAAGFLVNAVFESSLQSTQLRTLFWILMGLLVAMAHAAPTARPEVPRARGTAV